MLVFIFLSWPMMAFLILVGSSFAIGNPGSACQFLIPGFAILLLGVMGFAYGIIALSEKRKKRDYLAPMAISGASMLAFISFAIAAVITWKIPG